MTIQSSRRPSRPAKSIGLLLGGVSVVALLSLLSGCEGEPEVKTAARPVAAPAPAPPPPPAPTVTPVEELMAKYSIDSRIFLPENRAPDNDADRIAVLEFFDSFVRGDNEALAAVMSDLDRAELGAVSGTPAWKDTISAINEVLIETGTGPYGEKCALAIFGVGDDFQPQLWYYTVNNGSHRFDAAAAPPGIMDKLYGDDFIAVWHDLLQEEIRLANELDADIEVVPVVLGEQSGGSRRPSAGRSPKTPGFTPGGRPGKPDRRPPGKKRKPPGAR